MDDRQTRPSLKRAVVSGRWSLALAIVGLGFMAVPVLSLMSIALSITSIRASRSAQKDPAWQALAGFVLGVAELLPLAIVIWAFSTDNIHFH